MFGGVVGIATVSLLCAWAAPDAMTAAAASSTALKLRETI
jgi:hypothetical protein